MTIYCPRCGKPGCDETVVSFVSVWASCTNCQLVWRSSLIGTMVGYAARGVGLSRTQKVVDRYQPRIQAENPELQQPTESLTPVSVDRVAEWLATQERATGAPRLSVVPHSAAEAAKVEAMFDMLDPIGPVKTPSTTVQKEADDFYAFFAEQDLQLPIAAAVHAPPSETLSHADDTEDLWHLDEAEVAQPVEGPAMVIAQPSIPVEPVEHVEQMPPVQPVQLVELVLPVEQVQPVQQAQYVDQTEEDLEVPSERALSNVEELYEAFKRLEQQLGTITDSLQTYNPHP